MSEPDFKAHVFVCTNDRGPDGKRPSCAHKGSVEFRDKVKKLCKERGFPNVRVNSAGCLDQCERGIAAVVYPQAAWLLDLSPGQENLVVSAIEKALKS